MHPRHHSTTISYFSICICFVFLLSCQDRRSSKAKHSYPPTSFNELAVLFKAGPEVATVMSDTGLTSRQKKVFQKFFRKLNSDPKLERDIESYAKRLDETSHLTSDSEALTWIQKTGFSRDESIVLASIFNNGQLYMEKDSIIILKDNDSIHFNGTGRISILDSLVIYINDSSASFKGDKLLQLPIDSIARVADLLPADEHLEKYYCFAGTVGFTGLLPGADYYYLIVGRLNKTHRTYIYLKLKLGLPNENPRVPFYSIIIE